MKILITGANGFVGKNLAVALKQLKLGNDKTKPGLKIEEIYLFDVEDKLSKLDKYCKDCDFVFNLAGVNRSDNNDDFMKGNFYFLSDLIKRLNKNKNCCPIMLSSSIQASLVGKYKNSLYGQSKYAGEQLLFEYGKRYKQNVYIYRFPNLFGKWCKPNYNSVVATFCYNYAHDLPIRVDNPKTQLELLYIDDLVEEMLAILQGKAHHCSYDGIKVIDDNDGPYCYCPNTYKVRLEDIVNDLDLIKAQPDTLIIPDIKENSFIKKLYSTYLSYLPKEKVLIDLKPNEDDRGSFTELVKTVSAGQFSVNITKPGITRGKHFHHSKWEFFIVIKGRALIEQRNISTNERYRFEVSDDKLQAVHILPGFTHKIVNLSKRNTLITLMWANEAFDESHPDTFHEEV